MRQRWDVLIETLGTSGSMVGAEIGVAVGLTCRHLLASIPGLHLYLVDLWDHVDLNDPWLEMKAKSTEKKKKLSRLNKLRTNREELLTAISQFEGRYTLLIGDSVAMADNIEDQSLDFVFIDGDHSYDGCLRDIKAWTPKVKSDGWIIGHDYNPQKYPGVVAAVDECFDSVTLDDDWTWKLKK